MLDSQLVAQAEALLARYRAQGFRLALAESCTGGLLCALLTAVPGSSDVVERGFVTYSNEAKTELLGVPSALIEDKGAVSAEVAAAMAQGALRASRASRALSVTGIAGPGGATATKPLGLVFFGLATPQKVMTEQVIFAGDRAAVRQAAVAQALQLLGMAVTEE